MNDETPQGRGDASLVGKVIGAYRLLDRIGYGGSATVFRARHVGASSDVALKVSHPRLAESRNATQRFLREVQAIRRLDHPGCVGILDWGTHENRIYIVLELVEAQDLADVLSTEGRIEQRRAVSIALAACEVLEAAHALGVVHRDIKPRNIKLLAPDARGNERVKLVDFGLAKIFMQREVAEEPDEEEDVTKVETLTDPDTVLGTPKYMAPEQVGGDDIDGRADLYSIGIILYLMLTGRLPFEGDDALAWVLKMATKPTPQARELVPQIHPRLDAIVFKCMRRDREDRYASATELIEELRAVLDDLDEQLHDKPTDIQSPEERRRIIGRVLHHLGADRTTEVFKRGKLPSSDDTLASEGSTTELDGPPVPDDPSVETITAVVPSRPGLNRPPKVGGDDDPPTKTQKTRKFHRRIRKGNAEVELETIELKKGPRTSARREHESRQRFITRDSSILSLMDVKAVEQAMRRRRREIAFLVASLIILATVLVWRLS